MLWAVGDFLGCETTSNHFPDFLQRILTPLQAWTSRPQFAHLRWMVLALVINMRKSKLIHLAELTPSKNRKLSGRKYARKEIIRDFAPGVLRSHGQRVRPRGDRGWRRMRVAAVDGSLSRLGRVRTALCKRPQDPWQRVLAVATNETSLKAREIIAIYEQRWHIEVLFKELRDSLGLGDYQVIGRGAIERHLHLVCLTHLVPTHHSLGAGGAKARRANVQVDLPSMNERLAAMRAAIRREQLQQLLRQITHRKTKTLVKNYLFQEPRLQNAV
jgi:hypothetical protein